ncbi:MAG: lipoyl(octanoyl) transferase LipB [Rubrivivax sp.]|jgi:lipoyl(octanoyl) transferase|nr:lipoyl(octanoyl) transferase LipB [Rubrivivax sp.]
MLVKHLGRLPYAGIEVAMREFTGTRGADTVDELWLVEHEPVFTLGLAARPEHLLAPGSIPVVATQRGGQVTYHGPGQVTAYPLVDLARLGIYVKEYVHRLEEALLRTLAAFAVTGHRVRGAPGIYVRPHAPFDHARLPPTLAGQDSFAGLAKIAALGIKVSRSRSYHGLALNVAMDLEPFSRIDPCGYVGLATTDLRTLGVSADWDTVATRLASELQALLQPR